MKTLTRAKIKQILAAKVDLATTPQLITPFRLKTAKKNQLLAFLKPEVFHDKSTAHTLGIIELTLKKFAEHAVSIDGLALYSGPSLANFAIMDHHYGLINELSKRASAITTNEEREQIQQLYNLANPLPILGGHEILQKFPDLTVEQLDVLWNGLTSKRLRGGFYTQLITHKGEKFIGVSGFHPKQLAHYCRPGKSLLVFLVSSDTSWEQLRIEMVGDAYPERALPTSIRGHLARSPKDYGFEAVRITNNIIHLSAGPTEALYEIDNFLAAPFGLNVITQGAKLAQLLLAQGLTQEEIRQVMTNKEIHQQLEHKDTSDALELVKTLTNA